MKKLYLILMSLLGVVCLTACETGDLPTPDMKGEEDLSYLYLKSSKYDLVGYGFNTDPNNVFISVEQTSQRQLTYDGCKVVKDNVNSSHVHYNQDGQTWSEQYEMELSYSYDGLMCTMQAPNNHSEQIEYLDDIYLRIKTREMEDSKYVREYEGKKIIKESYYSNDKLIYEINYDYDGLNATYTYTHHVFVDNSTLGAWTQQVGGKISYLDDTYLRITSEEKSYINEYGDNFKEVITRIYDGKKCTKEEVHIQGTWNGYSYNNALKSLSVYEYNGLKCNGTHTQYFADLQPPFNEFLGEVSFVETFELEYLK